VSLNFANVLDILCLRDAELSANEMNKIEMNKIEMNKIEIKCCSVKNGRRKGSRDVPPLQISARGFIFNSR
jgi:transcription antitermination factor NusA-like protein